MRRSSRLRAPADFSQIYRSGVRVRMPSVTAVALVEGAGPARVGVTSSKRVGGAVVRNRAKRRMRAAAGEVLDAMRSGAGVVLQATTSTPAIEWQKLVGDVRAALKRAGVLDA